MAIATKLAKLECTRSCGYRRYALNLDEEMFHDGEIGLQEFQREGTIKIFLPCRVITVVACDSLAISRQGTSVVVQTKWKSVIRQDVRCGGTERKVSERQVKRAWCVRHLHHRSGCGSTLQPSLLEIPCFPLQPANATPCIPVACSLLDMKHHETHQSVTHKHSQE